MPADRRPLTTRNAAWAQALARSLAKRGATANGISLAGMGFATVGALAFVAAGKGFANPGFCLFLAAVCIQIRLLCNMFDGMVAVEGGRKGRAGDLFNEAPDRYEDIVLLAGAGYACGELWLGWAAAAFAVLTAYVRAFGASLGKGQDFCGPFAKPHRMFFLTLGTLATLLPLRFSSGLPSPLELALWLIAAGALFTAVRRVVRLYRQLS